jgi:hypothetical protein
MYAGQNCVKIILMVDVFLSAITYCKCIGTVANTSLTPSTGPYPVGQVAVHTCLDGHRFHDGTRIKPVQCQPDGTWDRAEEEGCFREYMYIAVP